MSGDPIFAPNDNPIPVEDIEAEGQSEFSWSNKWGKMVSRIKRVYIGELTQFDATVYELHYAAT